jgi:hypothetical protein
VISRIERLRLQRRLFSRKPTRTCACCGYVNIFGDYDICDICGWQEDDTQEAEPMEAIGHNSVCLLEAQANYAAHGVIHPIHTESVRPADEEDVRDPNWRPLVWQTCVCCGYRSLGRGELDKCDICRWRRDPGQEASPDSAGGPNSVSLRQAQRNFVTFGACDEESKLYARQPEERDLRDPEWKPLA